MIPLLLALVAGSCQESYPVRKDHPRIFSDDARGLAPRVLGPMAPDYRAVLERVDAAVRRGGKD